MRFTTRSEQGRTYKSGSGRTLYKNVTGILIITLLSALISACGGGSSSGVSVNLTGTWSGSWRSSNGQTGALGGSWTQSGGTFSGPTTIYSSACFKNEYSTGTVSGSTIQIAIVNNGIIFDGSVSGSTISGTYLVYASGACYGDAGTFVLTKSG